MSGKHDNGPIVPADAEGIAAAVARLRDGGLDALPSETVYGLAARADSSDAVAAIYRTKGRPDFNPLIVHVVGVEQAESIALLDDSARALAAAFWPGALTLVLPLRDGARIAPAVTAGLPTIALRCPAHPVMRAVLAQSGLALAAPSANRSGGVSPTRAAHVADSLGEAAPLILDGGDCAEGIESTIVALRNSGEWEILRPGPITEQQIADVLGAQPRSSVNHGIEAPGQLVSHYAPGKPVRLGVTEAEADEFVIGFGPITGDISLSPSGDLAEAAARLYGCLHVAAASAKPRIAVAPVSDDGIGAAINDRLRRAAA